MRLIHELWGAEVHEPISLKAYQRGVRMTAFIVERRLVLFLY